MFSGVFQPQNDLPYLHPINVTGSDFKVDSTFKQYYNHYHCAAVPLYSSKSNEMHTLFFGGIAQYFDSSGFLVKDDNVPFVKTIARLTRNSNGKMAEYKLPIEMPSLLGAGSEFIPIPSLPTYTNGVIKLDEFSNDTLTIGYIFGGISSSAANIFWINNGTQSSASSQLFKVRLIKNQSSSVHQMNPYSVSSLNFEVYPNPGNGSLHIKYHLMHKSDVVIKVNLLNGKMVNQIRFSGKNKGNHNLELELKRKGFFLISIETDYETLVQKILIQ